MSNLYIVKGFVCQWLDGPEVYGNLAVREATLFERLFHRWFKWELRP